tara:strand:- start:2911 stop:3414 length:504 start_codon:yes stop_codon:yes gene_type:complete
MTEKSSEENILIGTYGTLKRGMGNHRWYLEGKSLYIGTGRTEKKRYMCGESSSFPYMSESVMDDGSHCLLELFSVTKDVVFDIDGLEGYHGPDSEYNHYNKISINVWSNKYEKTIRVFVYVRDIMVDGVCVNPSPSEDGNWRKTQISDEVNSPNKKKRDQIREVHKD